MGKTGVVDQWRTEEALIKLQGWARDGLTDMQIAHNIGINVATLYRWKEKWSDIRDSLKKGKEVADYEVENSLFNKACGYSVEILKPFKCKKVEYDGNGRKLKEEETVEYAKEEVYVPADTAAMIFWLKNRKPSVWRDKMENVPTETEAGVIEIPMVNNE